MSLYRAETRRLTKRRFTRWLVIGSLAVLATVAIGVAFTNRKVGPEQVTEAKAQATSGTVTKTTAPMAVAATARGSPPSRSASSKTRSPPVPPLHSSESPIASQP